MDVDDLKASYQIEFSKAERLKTALIKEITELLSRSGISLGVPLEARIKTWDSIEEKLTRRSLSLSSISDLNDLVGVRIIVLFRSDLDLALQALKETFSIVSLEDVALRLQESQFGYQSQHAIVQLPVDWSKIPSFVDLCQLKAEIQIRTVAQHIWAAASHKLQYKQEHSVPPPLRRTIHRISALLETVDLELDRVLEERRQYKARDTVTVPTEMLNVDLLAAELNALLPAENKSGDESYGDLLDDLIRFGINSVEDLRNVVNQNREFMMSEEQKELKREPRLAALSKRGQERRSRGVFFTHVGLARQALAAHVGRSAWDEHNARKRASRSAEKAKTNTQRAT